MASRFAELPAVVPASRPAALPHCRRAPLPSAPCPLRLGARTPPAGERQQERKSKAHQNATCTSLTTRGRGTRTHARFAMPGDLRDRLGAERTSAGGAAPSPPEPPTFAIPEDSPFARSTAGGESGATGSSQAPAEPFNFSFSLGTTAAPTSKSVATYNLAAPVVASTVPVPSAEVKPEVVSRKVPRQRRGKPRPSHEEQHEGSQDEGEWGEGDEPEGEGGASPALRPASGGTGASGAPASTAACTPLTFDASKFEMSSFAKALPEPPAPP